MPCPIIWTVRTAAADWPPVTLICGEEMLCKKALKIFWTS
jgi:hypothetical protein